ncbi:helix-turn-helix domain-containing protein [Carboxylicivirga caseinilyticus]|uniref:helix-turn-helix domain-containing protein n=1 Tax=Carboxylicivirga caseinilyticus TaxID=3417572 RepID=UPI003D34308D|nr:helix-turn-helix domain-containing protein [Marinilabiliaceae bacterium A049]
MKCVSFKDKLIEVRKAKGLTQEEVANLCKITARTIQRIETGAVSPRPYTIKLISEVLGFEYYYSANKKKLKVLESVKSDKISFFKRNKSNYKNLIKSIIIVSTLIIVTAVLLAFLYPEDKSSVTIENSLIGKWRLCITDDTPWEDLFERKGYYRYKIISTETFIVVDTDSLSKNFYSYFMGNYQAYNGIYSETIQHTDSCFSMMADVTNIFKYILKGDTLYLEGTNNCYNEIWKKVE